MPTATLNTVRRHEFSNDILRRVRACYKTDNWHGPLEIIEHWLIIAAWVWLSIWVWQTQHVALGVAVYLLAVFFIGGRQRALAGVLHQACHGTLMRNARMSHILGTLLAGYPVLQSFTGYRASHVVKHHGHFADPQIDPDYIQYRNNKLCGENLSREALRDYLLRLLGPRATLSYITYLIRDRILNKDEERWESYVRVAYVVLVVAVAALTGWLDVFAAYWLVPLVTTQVWIGAVSELLEHYPMIECAPRIDILMTRNRICGLLSTFLVGEKQGEGYHLVHHLFPRVPLWRVKEAHEILKGDPEYAALYTPKGFVGAVRSIFRSLPEATP